MTDQPLRELSALLSTPALLRSRQVSLAGNDKVVTLAKAPVDTAPATVEAPAAMPPTRDWVSALDLIKEASEAIRIGEERANDLETQFAAYVEQAQQEVRRLSSAVASGELSLIASEDRARAAETRASEAEARASEAEAWLAQLHDAVVTSFGPIVRDVAARNANTADPAKKFAE